MRLNLALISGVCINPLSLVTSIQLQCLGYGFTRVPYCRCSSLRGVSVVPISHIIPLTMHSRVPLNRVLGVMSVSHIAVILVSRIKDIAITWGLCYAFLHNPFPFQTSNHLKSSVILNRAVLWVMDRSEMLATYWLYCAAVGVRYVLYGICCIVLHLKCICRWKVGLWLGWCSILSYSK